MTIVLILEMRTLKNREVMRLAESHTAGQGQRRVEEASAAQLSSPDSQP